MTISYGNPWLTVPCVAVRPGLAAACGKDSQANRGGLVRYVLMGSRISGHRTNDFVTRAFGRRVSSWRAD